MITLDFFAMLTMIWNISVVSLTTTFCNIKSLKFHVPVQSEGPQQPLQMKPGNYRLLTCCRTDTTAGHKVQRFLENQKGNEPL